MSHGEVTEATIMGGSMMGTMSIEEYAGYLERQQARLDARIDANRIVPDVEGRDLGRSALSNTTGIPDHITSL